MTALRDPRANFDPSSTEYVDRLSVGESGQSANIEAVVVRGRESSSIGMEQSGFWAEAIMGEQPWDGAEVHLEYIENPSAPDPRLHVIQQHFVDELRSLAGIRAVYAVEDDDKLCVIVQLEDYWSDVRSTIHGIIYDLRRQIGGVGIDFRTVPADADSVDLQHRSDIVVFDV